jgi:hypothetical protein
LARAQGVHCSFFDDPPPSLPLGARPCISEEENGYTVQVRLCNEIKPENSAWGEEIADSFETASELIAALAGEFSIAQACIKIEIRMHNHKQSTRH